MTSKDEMEADIYALAVQKSYFSERLVLFPEFWKMGG